MSPPTPNTACIVAARRTAVAQKNGAFRDIEVADLAAAPIRAVLSDAGLDPADVDEVILGNALYGGGNPARMAALAAGLREEAPALTIDSQCCAGLDALILAVGRIHAGEARVVIAGGVESYSRAPIRMRRPKSPDDKPQPYDRPPFAPWPERDPDMIPAAAALAALQRVSRARQEAFAIDSHHKALAYPSPTEIVPLAGQTRDALPRPLTAALCARMPVLAGEPVYGVTAATTAAEADAAGVLLVVKADVPLPSAVAARRRRLVCSVRAGGDPALPGLAPVAAIHSLLARQRLTVADIDVAEIMEAFAAQAIACIDGAGLDPARVNRGGGALSRGHPIGASGAILAVRLWHELQRERQGAIGLAAIAAAGGLGTAILMSG